MARIMDTPHTKVYGPDGEGGARVMEGGGKNKQLRCQRLMLSGETPCYAGSLKR